MPMCSIIRIKKSLLKKGHHFKTSTDVEVILHLYEDLGKNSIKNLRGMFAFAIWDSKNQDLFIGRDHLGQKPLFFYQKDVLFVFANFQK